ncbi:hypothetical protein ACFPYI_06895 [Halomarina salina]|uniref:SWIM-type domain-containing protein n=1 Tax=Halomarina salina TaxID=1872699 RepID=A0ABD5RKJ0_9EURY|nr:hypothetical protein [Halomarina salina]
MIRKQLRVYQFTVCSNGVVNVNDGEITRSVRLDGADAARCSCGDDDCVHVRLVNEHPHIIREALVNSCDIVSVDGGNLIFEPSERGDRLVAFSDVSDWDGVTDALRKRGIGHGAVYHLPDF